MTSPVEIAARLSPPMSEALLLLHETQGTRERGSGVKWNTFDALDRLGLAVERDGAWYATGVGVEAIGVLRGRL